jgi:hypothetical protein
MLPTALAGDCTVAAQRGIAVLTIEAVILIHGAAAIRARNAVPVDQLDITTAPAVGVEQL